MQCARLLVRCWLCLNLNLKKLMLNPLFSDAPTADETNSTPLVVGAAVGGLAALGAIGAVIFIIFKVKSKLASASFSLVGSGANGSGQALLSGGSNSVAPVSSSYEPALDNVRIPDAPNAFGYDGSGGIGGPATYDAPPSHLTPINQPPQAPEIPQFTNYMMAGQEPALPGIPGSAGYQIPDIVAPAVYRGDLWL